MLIHLHEEPVGEGSEDVGAEGSKRVGAEQSRSERDRSINLDDLYDSDYMSDDKEVQLWIEESKSRTIEAEPMAEKAKPRARQAETRAGSSVPRTEVGKIQLDVSSNYANSDDLDSHETLDEERDDTFNIFKEKTDLSNVSFKLDMKFKSFVILKSVIRAHTINGGHNVKLVKNDKVRV